MLAHKTAEIVELKRNIGSNVWLIGNRLLEIKSQQLYLELYGTWTEFLTMAVDISERSAQRFMRIAENFNQELVSQWGASKCDLLLNVEEPERQELMYLVAPNVSKRQLEQIISLRNNESNAYFLKTEQLLKETLHHIKSVKDHLAGCKLKEGYTEYIRKKQIEELWENIKTEVYHGNNGME